MDGPTWTFTQLGGDRKTFTLSGWAAPFGRPREEAVVRTPIKVRTERTRYPGGTNTTRHVFGDQYEDWEMHGRFRDRALGGTGGARAKHQELEAFVRDQQPIRITWGAILSFEAFIVEYDPGFESPAEIEWKLKIEVDANDNVSKVIAQALPSPPDFGPSLLAALEDITGAINAVRLPGDLGDLIGNLLGVFNTAAAAVLAPVEQLRSFKDATFADLARAISAVHTFRRTGIELRDTFEAIPTDVGHLQRRADDVTGQLRSQAEVEDQMRTALGEASRLERGATLALLGRVKGTVVATDGDTWENLSNRVYGAPDRAGDLRDANSVPPGQPPTPGREYLVPV